MIEKQDFKRLKLENAYLVEQNKKLMEQEKLLNQSMMSIAKDVLRIKQIKARCNGEVRRALVILKNDAIDDNDIDALVTYLAKQGH